MTTHDSDQIAAASASNRERLRPPIRRSTSSCPMTMTPVLAANAQPSRLGDTPPTSVA